MEHIFFAAVFTVIPCPATWVRIAFFQLQFSDVCLLTWRRIAAVRPHVQRMFLNGALSIEYLAFASFLNLGHVLLYVFV